MVEIKGFKTKKEAEYFIKKNRKGILTSNQIRNYLYKAAEVLYGLDTKKYKYCVQWTKGE